MGTSTAWAPVSGNRRSAWDHARPCDQCMTGYCDGPLSRCAGWGAHAPRGRPMWLRGRSHAPEAVVVGVAAVRRVEPAPGPAAGVGRARPRAAPQHPRGRPGRLFGAARITARADRVVVRVVPVAAPLAHVAAHPQHAAPAAVAGIVVHPGRALHLRDMPGQPAGRREVPPGRRPPPLSYWRHWSLLVNSRPAISSAHRAAPRNPFIPPGKGQARGAAGRILPLGLGRQPRPRPPAGGLGVLPADRAHRQPGWRGWWRRRARLGEACFTSEDRHA
jgi:hypothetical protein